MLMRMPSTDDGTSGKFNPSFPGTCPYVTSVGGTQIKPGASVTSPEEAVQTVVHSGGGFSNVFPLPSFQSSAVKSYFTNHKPSYTAAQYNNSQATRGYPDISANAANYAVALNGKIQLVYGTSASCPTVASIITLINEQRVNAGKKPVGYINPTLYANPTMFNDITTGGNAGTFHSRVKLHSATPSAGCLVKGRAHHYTRLWHSRLHGRLGLGSSDWVGNTELPKNVDRIHESRVNPFISDEIYGSA